MIDFNRIVNIVSVREYAESIGYNISANGMIQCPFHNDINPSMKVDNRYHCFGCGADGNVINFVADLNGISKSDAAKRIMAEFELDFDNSDYYKPPPKQNPLSMREWRNINVSYLIRIENELKFWMEDYKAEPDAEHLHPLFVSAVQNVDYVSYLIESLMECKTEDEISHFKEIHEGEVVI